jgi:two-component system, OmpR family, KDP operon response regulator KdpE
MNHHQDGHHCQMPELEPSSSTGASSRSLPGAFINTCTDANTCNAASRCPALQQLPRRHLGHDDSIVAELTFLVIDDEPQIRRVVKHALETDHARVLEAATARAGLDIAASERVDLVVLDVGLPDQSGLEVCRDMRGWSAAPILVLSARHSEHEKASLLDAGADDYITKPFSTVELQARVRAQLRRARMTATDSIDSHIEARGIVIDLAKRVVTRAGSIVHLTPIEWELLRVLSTNAGRTMTHRQLFSQVWVRAHGDAQQYLRVHVANLRHKLEQDPVQPRLIITEPGVGYRFDAEE